MSVTAAYPATTAEAIAGLLNLTPRWVRQLAKEGVIPKPERGKYDLTGAVQGYVKYLQARADGRGVEGQDAHTERVRLVRARARRAELEADALEGTLLLENDVVFAWQQIISAFRARTLAIPSRLAPQLVMIHDRKTIQAILTQEVRAALQELSGFDLASAAPARDPQGRSDGETAGANGKSRRITPVH
jgi:phage terminase Nu1 subunit (DNA packaging protein)